MSAQVNTLHYDSQCHERHDLVRDFPVHRPTIVCLCGSTRFAEAFRVANLREALAGHIVLTIGCDLRSDADLAAAGELDAYAKTRLDELHHRKIDLADEALVLNVGGYVGESTRGEVEYAASIGRPVRWLEGEDFRRGEVSA